MKKFIVSFMVFLFLNNGQLRAQTESLLIKNTWLPNKRVFELKVADTLLLSKEVIEVAGDLKFLATQEFEMLHFNRECVSVPSRSGKPRKNIIKGNNVWVNGGKWAVKAEEVKLIFATKTFILNVISASEKEILLEVLNIE